MAPTARITKKTDAKILTLFSAMTLSPFFSPRLSITISAFAEVRYYTNTHHICQYYKLIVKDKHGVNMTLFVS